MIKSASNAKKSKSFSLIIDNIGTGVGYVTGAESKTYLAGSQISLRAVPEVGSVFKGWHGVTMVKDTFCTFTMRSNQSISAEFEWVGIPDIPIIAELFSIGRHEVKSYQYANIFILKLHNKGEKEIRVKVPLTSYKIPSGQTSEQASWYDGYVNGSKGVTLSSDAFCQMGLVHSEKPAIGDKLYVTVEQVKSLARIYLTFQCTQIYEKIEIFKLIESSFQNQKGVAHTKETSPSLASSLKRIESLESALAGVLLRLDTMESTFSHTTRNKLLKRMAPTQTLFDIFSWVAENDKINVAELRAQLLPLDLLPSAAINELNERALDVVGELALEEVGDEIIISKLVMSKIIDKTNNDFYR